MSNLNQKNVSQVEIEKLKDKCHILELKVAKVMLELLEELEYHKEDEVLDCEVKESIKALTNRIFETRSAEGA